MIKIKENENVLTIEGKIKNYDDFEKIKNTLDDMEVRFNELIIRIINSEDITSSFLGYLYKLKEKDNKKIVLEIQNDSLYEMLNDLNVEFKIEKIQ